MAEKSDMKQKIATGVIFVVLSLMLGSMGCVATGCKSQPKIHVIQNPQVVTSTVPAKAFNDEKYVWENFYFSTNQVKTAK